jgi:hypothetical protein
MTPIENYIVIGMAFVCLIVWFFCRKPKGGP